MTHVFPLLRVKQICIQPETKNFNILNHDSVHKNEYFKQFIWFKIVSWYGFVKVHDAAWAELVLAINADEIQLKSKREHASDEFIKSPDLLFIFQLVSFTCLCCMT